MLEACDNRIQVLILSRNSGMKTKAKQKLSAGTAWLTLRAHPADHAFIQVNECMASCKHTLCVPAACKST